MRQALVCPYCRDAVTRRGTLACARRACGALYHRECWDECERTYGGCAVFGCESRRAREVSLLGWALRTTRLTLAALLFPRRLVSAIRQHAATSPRSVFEDALHAARDIRERMRGTMAWMPIAIFLGLPLSIFALAALANRLSALGPVSVVLGFFALFAIPFSASVWLPPLFAFFAVLVHAAVKILHAALKAELAALARVDQGVETVVERMRGGGSLKVAE